jgi:hypothetical protein
MRSNATGRAAIAGFRRRSSRRLGSGSSASRGRNKRHDSFMAISSTTTSCSIRGKTGWPSTRRRCRRNRVRGRRGSVESDRAARSVTATAIVERRLTRLSGRLSLNVDRALAWSFAQAVLSAIWSVEDGFSVDARHPVLGLANVIRAMLPPYSLRNGRHRQPQEKPGRSTDRLLRGPRRDTA